jgi:serine/threonine protein kinase
MSPSADALVGRVLGGYQLLSVQGTGGTGTVYLAAKVDAREQQVAVKVLTPPAGTTPADLVEFKARFQREAKALQLLAHPHILTLIAYGEDEQSGLAYMVLPLMAGGTLTSRLSQGGVSLEDAARYASQIADALDYAHDKGIVHRDLKPGNVLLDEQGEVFLADFGIAKIFDTAGTTVMTLTSTGQIMGTADYMSPEQAQGQDVTAASDIYSFGMVLYHLTTGQVAFEGKSLTQVLLQIATTPPIPPRRLRPTLPAPAEAAILKALAKQPIDRFKTAGELASAFSQGLENRWAAGLRQAATLDTFVPQQTIAQPRDDERRRDAGPLTRPPVLIAGVSALLIVAITGTLLLTGVFTHRPGGSSTQANIDGPTATSTLVSATASPTRTASRPATATVTARQSGNVGGGPQPTSTNTPIPPLLHGNLVINPTALALGNFCGQPLSGVGITLSNTGNGSLTWSLQGGSGFNLSPTSGQLNAGASLPVAVSGTKSNTSFKIGWLDGGQGTTNTVTATVTCTSPVVNFFINPTSTSYDCNANPGVPAPSTIFTLDNTGSNIDVGWQITVNDPPNFVRFFGVDWASLSATQGTVAAGSSIPITLLPYTNSTTGGGVCTSEGTIPPSAYPWTVTVTLTSGGSGSYTFTYYITATPPPF